MSGGGNAGGGSGSAYHVLSFVPVVASEELMRLALLPQQLVSQGVTTTKEYNTIRVVVDLSLERSVIERMEADRRKQEERRLLEEQQKQEQLERLREEEDQRKTLKLSAAAVVERQKNDENEDADVLRAIELSLNSTASSSMTSLPSSTGLNVVQSSAPVLETTSSPPSSASMSSSPSRSSTSSPTPIPAPKPLMRPKADSVAGNGGSAATGSALASPVPTSSGTPVESIERATSPVPIPKPKPNYRNDDSQQPSSAGGANPLNGNGSFVAPGADTNQKVKKLSSFLEFEQGLPPPDPWDIPRTLNEDLHDVLELSLATNGPAARTATPPVKTTAAPAPVQATTTMTTTTTTAPTYQARPQQPQPTPQQPLQYPVNSYYPPPAQLPTQQQQQQHVANYNFSGASYNDNPGGYQSLSHPHPPPQQQQHQTFQPQRPHHMGVATPFVQPSRPPVVVAETPQQHLARTHDVSIDAIVKAQELKYTSVDKIVTFAKQYDRLVSIGFKPSSVVIAFPIFDGTDNEALISYINVFERLCDMGFKETLVQEAMLMSENREEDALEFIMRNAESRLD